MSVPEYSVVWLDEEVKPRLIASKWIFEKSDAEIYCLLPLDEDKTKFNSAVFKLKEIEDSWVRKIVKKIKYQTGIL